MALTQKKNFRFQFKGVEGVHYSQKSTMPVDNLKLLFDDDIVGKIIEYINKRETQLWKIPRKLQKGRATQK